MLAGEGRGLMLGEGLNAMGAVLLLDEAPGLDAVSWNSL